MTGKMKKTLILAIVAGVIWVSSADVIAVNYYVDGTSGDDNDPGTINEPWQTINKASSTLQAGDTVCIRGGTYTNQQINPSNSGTSGNYITYARYGSDTVTISGGYDQADLSDRSYIKIDGLRFTNAGHSWIDMAPNGQHCIIQNCEFEGTGGYTGLNMNHRCDYNKILNNTFLDSCMPKDHIECWDSSYNLFEGNHFGQAGHFAINLQARGTSVYNIVRNNTFENTLHSNLGVWRNADYTLVEGNIIKNAGDACDLESCPQNTCGSEKDRTAKRWHHAGIQLGSKYCIIRRNVMTNNGRFSMNAKDETQNSVHNRIYHNTMYKDYIGMQTASGGCDIYGNIIKNNIFYEHRNYAVVFAVGSSTNSDNTWTSNNLLGASIKYKGTTGNVSTIESNYPSEWSDNIAIDPKLTDPANHDFTLQSTSPMIDAGAWLTTITSSTANSQTSFKADDARYFYAGWDISGEIGDTIKTESGQITTIQSINYDTNIITVNPAINIVKNEGIALNYEGTFPDIGAYEYGASAQDTEAPKVASFNINPTTANTNEQITASYTVTDNKALKQVELHRTIDKNGSPDANNWNWIKTQSVSGTSASGSFTDSLSTAGTYWYGIHVIDQAGKVGFEPSPIKVTVNSEITGASYYVKPNGNDSLDGRSNATAWRTISKVNNYSFQTGDDVYFKCGGTWTGTRLNIDWSGISGNSVVIGAYYMSGGNEVHGSNGNKPVFDGNNAVPGEYLGLINVYRQDCVTIENIKIVNSLCDGVRFSGSKTIDATNNNATNIDTGHIYKAGIKYHHIDTGVVEGCDVADTCRTELGGGGWPAALSVTYSSNITVRKNSVRENYGEGIGIYKISDNCIVENNLCYANKKVQIYIDSSAGTVVRGNLCYGTIDSAYWRGSFPGLGIGIADEGWVPSHSENNKIYNNLVAYSSLGIFLWRAHDDPGWSLKDTFVYNNVVIDCLTNLTVSNRNVFENSAIKNNIFWSISGDSVQAAVPSSHSGLVLDYNLWSSAPDSDARGVNDPSYAAPQLLKTSGWRSMTGGDIQGNDFALQPTSPAIDAGTNLGSPYNQGLDKNSTWPNNVFTLDQNNYGSGCEIGAFVFTGTDADINNDGKINIEDFAILAAWRDDDGGCVEPGWCGGSDFNMSGTIDMLDLAYFVENWLRHGE